MPFLFETALPAWMRFVEGAAPIVLVAPHGGRRPADAPIKDSIKVNDLHTAELTAELAARTRGYALINHAFDRNELDLNRISQVRTRAPWFLDALLELVAFLVERHGEARVFFIHGWNVVQPVCDLGMGMRQREHEVLPASKFAAPTLSPTFFSTAVAPFREMALARGLDVAIGRRYPAADKENVMQLFSARFAKEHAPTIRRLAELSALGVVNALQLELGVGLRWPGAERDQFIEAFHLTLGHCAGLPSIDGGSFAAMSPPVTTANGVHAPDHSLFAAGEQSVSKRFGLHFHDPLSGVGIMGGVEANAEDATHGGRLMLSLGGTEMALFTGEDEARGIPGHMQVGGLVWRGEPDGFAITYAGPVMRFSHPQAFIRLEEGLAASWVERAEVHLRLTIPSRVETLPTPLFLAQLRGEICLQDRAYRIDAWGFLDAFKPEESGRLLPRRLVSLPFGPDLGLFLSLVETPEGPRSSGVLYQHGVPHQLHPDDWELHYHMIDGRPTTFQVSVASAARLSLQCYGESVTSIPIVRHAAQGSALNVTFGLSRTIWQGREARGVYEFSERRRE